MKNKKYLEKHTAVQSGEMQSSLKHDKSGHPTYIHGVSFTIFRSNLQCEMI